MLMYDKESIEAISKFLISHNKTIAVAESVTAGCLQNALSLGEGATQFFQGGLTVYNITQKHRHLHIEPAHLISCNCVSKKVAAEMALQVNKLFMSDWAIGVTGYASIIPELNINKLFAHYAFALKNDIIKSGIIESKLQEPNKVQQFYTNYILKDFIDIAKNIIKHTY